jgi:hypothetical protein
MSNVENIEHQVKALSPEELAAFRRWFLAYDWEVWDRQLEQDVAAGKLDALAGKALRDHAAGKSTKL